MSNRIIKNLKLCVGVFLILTAIIKIIMIVIHGEYENYFWGQLVGLLILMLIGFLFLLNVKRSLKKD